jgi:tRNA(Ile2) C34 agmatinyltransferase TiaS
MSTPPLCLSLLLPATSTTKLPPTLPSLHTLCSRTLSLPRSSYQLFALVPLEDHHLAVNATTTPIEVAVRVIEQSSLLSVKGIEEVVACKEKYRVTLEKTNEAMLAYVEELKQIKRFVIESGSQDDVEE